MCSPPPRRTTRATTRGRRYRRCRRVTIRRCRSLPHTRGAQVFVWNLWQRHGGASGIDLLAHIRRGCRRLAVGPRDTRQARRSGLRTRSGRGPSSSCRPRPWAGDPGATPELRRPAGRHATRPQPTPGTASRRVPSPTAWGATYGPAPRLIRLTDAAGGARIPGAAVLWDPASSTWTQLPRQSPVISVSGDTDGVDGRGAARVGRGREPRARSRSRRRRRGEGRRPPRTVTRAGRPVRVRGVRIGLALPQYDYSVPGENPLRFETIATYARRAEELGFDSLWLSDHLFLDLEKYGGSRERFGAYEPLTTLAALASVVDAPRLGTLVLCEALRPGDGARQGPRDPRPDLRRPPRRRPRRRLVRTRLRGDRHGDAAAGRSRRPAPRSGRGRARPARRRAARRSTGAHRADGAVVDPPALPTPAPAGVHRRQGRPRDPHRGRGSPTGGTRAGSWSPPRYRARLDVVERACDETGRDPATFWRSLGIYALCGENETDLARRFERLQRAVAEGHPRRRLPRRLAGRAGSWARWSRSGSRPRPGPSSAWRP